MAIPTSFPQQATPPQPAQSRTSGALVLNINAPLNNHAGDESTGGTPGSNPAGFAPSAPAIGAGPSADTFQRRNNSPFAPNPAAPPKEQLEQSYFNALNIRNDAEQARNSYLNLANQLNGQAFQTNQTPQAIPAAPPAGSGLPTPPPTPPALPQADPAQFQQQLGQLQQMQQAQLKQQQQQFQQQLQQQQAQQQAQTQQLQEQLLQQQQQNAQLQQQQQMMQQLQAQQQAQQAQNPYGQQNPYAQMDPMMQQQLQQQQMMQQMQQAPDPYAQMDPMMQQQLQQQQMMQQAQQAQNPYAQMDPMMQQQLQQQQAAGQPNPYTQYGSQPSGASQQQGTPNYQTLRPEELNMIIANPQPSNEKLSAILEFAARQQGNRETYELLKNEAMMDTSQLPPGQGQEDGNLIRQAALFALGNLNRAQNSQVETSQLPGLDAINNILKNPNENPAVKAAAVTALGYIDRPNDKVVKGLLNRASKDPNQDVKNAVQQVQSGMMSAAAQGAPQAGAPQIS